MEKVKTSSNMKIVFLIDRREDRAVASARAFASRVDTVWIDCGGEGNQFQLMPDGAVELRDLPEGARESILLTVSHSGDSRNADVLFTTDFRPEVVGSGGIWIWRSVTEEAPITALEAGQMIEWMERGAPHEEEELPPVLRRGMGMPTLAAIAVVCQAMLSDMEGRAREFDWRSVFGARKDCLESTRIEWGEETEDDGDWEIVREFIEMMFDASTEPWRRHQIETCLQALGRRFYGR